MAMNSDLDSINQPAQLRHLNQWQQTNALPTTLPQHPSTEALQEHHSAQDLKTPLKQLCWQNEELTAIHQVLEAQRQRYQEIFEFAPDGYLGKNLAGVMLAANQAGKLLNYCAKQLISKPLLLFAIAHNHQKFCSLLSQLHISNQPQEWFTQILPGKMPSFPGLFKIAIEGNHAQVTGLRWFLQDIIQHKHYKAALETDQSNLEKQVAQRTFELLKANQQLQQQITERQRVEAQLRQQTQWQHLMMAMQARIRQSLNLEEILNTTVAQVRQFLSADRVVIYQVNSTGAARVLAESVDGNCMSLLGMTIDTLLFKERIIFYRQGETRVVDDIQQVAPTAINQFLQQQDVKASLTLPILHGNQFWGLLAIHQCKGVRQWQQLEVELLQQLATQVSIAIGQSELYCQLLRLNNNLESQVQQRTAQLQKSLDFEAVLKRISDDVRDTLDESQILQTAVWELAVALNIDGCNTGLYDANHTTSTISYEYTVGIDAAHGHVVQMKDFSEGYIQLLQGQYFQFCELVTRLRADPVAILALPIVDNQGVIGDLWLFKQREDAFDELEIRLVQQVANQCAIAIRQARLYQAAKSQIKELETLNRLKDDFLDTISHELRTPLANMKMAIQMLGLALNQNQDLFAQLAKPAAEQGKVARYYQILNNECERQLNLVNDLLDLQHLSTRAEPLVLTSIQVEVWLPQIVESFQGRAQNHQQNLSMEISPNLPSLICEPASLGRVIAELLNNACKYTPLGEKIAVKVHAQAGIMELSVSNSGAEIPSNQLSRIFDKFYRLPSNDFWNQGGTGLGLALVQQLVTHMGGKISVESSAQQTCFTVKLPLMKEQA